MKYFLQILFFTCCASLCLGETDLASFQDRFQEELEKLEADHAQKISRLRGPYLAALMRLEAESRHAGDLEGLIAVRDELVRAEEAEDLLLEGDIAHEGIRRLQAALRQQVEEIDQETSARKDVMIRNVQQYAARMSSEVLRSGDVDGAVAWRDWGRGLQLRLNPQRQIVGPEETPPGEVRLSPAIKVVRARYGARDRWMDVTEKVREALEETEGLQIGMVSNEWAGRDPYGGVVKTLQVEFDMAGKRWVYEAQEGHAARLSVEDLHEKGRALLAGE